MSNSQSASTSMLLAKSISPLRGPYSLADHLTDTEAAALELFDGTRLGRNWVRFWNVDPRIFLTHLRVAALAHDLGKANSGFQNAVTHKGEQSHRHEHLSALILLEGQQRGLLGTNLDWDIVLAAVVGHHCKATDRSGRHLFLQHQTDEKPTLLLNESLNPIWDRICTLAGVPPSPCPLPDFDQLFQLRPRLLEQADDFSYDLKDDPERRCLNAAVRTAVICSDSLASACFRTGRTLQAWMADSIHRPALGPEDLQTLLDDRYPGTEPYGWQQQIAHGSDRQAVIVGCGGGKSRAAWEWARERMNHWDLGRVLFLYPTQGTALEGFKDYAAAAGPAEALLLSGVAALDLEAIASNPTDSDDPQDFRTDETLFALGAWDRRIFTGTVDQFLGAWEFQYGALCHLPLLADAALILDEVHAYDERMWARVKSLLLHTRGPVLLLSATLQQHRIDDLRDLGVTIHQGGGSTRKPTYRFRLVTEAEARVAVAEHKPLLSDPEASVHQGRVLLVSNTVDRCQQRGREFGADIVYHSRFRRIDRAEQHKQTLSCLRGEGMVAATQVCEMSLDVSASLMVTDLCDIPGLIQRAGRVNRYGEYEFADILVVIPPDAKPYEPAALTAAQSLVEAIAGEVVDQEQLATRMKEFLPASRSARQWGQLYDSGYWAISRDFRDTDDYTVQALLYSDRDEAINLVGDRATRHRLQNLLCPAPYWWVKKQRATRASDHHPDLPPWVWVIPADSYCSKRGLQTQ